MHHCIDLKKHIHLTCILHKLPVIIEEKTLSRSVLLVAYRQSLLLTRTERNI